MVNIQDELLAEDIDAVGARAGTAPRPKMDQRHQDNRRRTDSATAHPEHHDEPSHDLVDHRQDSSSLQGSSNFASELRHRDPNIPAHADQIGLESRTRSSVARDVASFDHRSNRQRRPLSNLKTNLQLK